MRTWRAFPGGTPLLSQPTVSTVGDRESQYYPVLNSHFWSDRPGKAEFGVLVASILRSQRVIMNKDDRMAYEVVVGSGMGLLCSGKISDIGDKIGDICGKIGNICGKICDICKVNVEIDFEPRQKIIPTISSEIFARFARSPVTGSWI